MTGWRSFSLCHLLWERWRVACQLPHRQQTEDRDAGTQPAVTQGYPLAQSLLPPACCWHRDPRLLPCFTRLHVVHTSGSDVHVLALPLPWLSFPDDQSCILHVSEARQPLSAQRLRLLDPVVSGWKCPLSNTRVASAKSEVKMPWAVGPKVLGSLALPPSLCFSHSGLPEMQNKGQQVTCHRFFQSLHWQVRGGGGAEAWGGAMLCPGQGQDKFTEPPHVTSTFRVLLSAICSHPTGGTTTVPTSSRTR